MKGIPLRKLCNLLTQTAFFCTILDLAVRRLDSDQKRGSVGLAGRRRGAREEAQAVREEVGGQGEGAGGDRAGGDLAGGDLTNTLSNKQNIFTCVSPLMSAKRVAWFDRFDRFTQKDLV